MTQEELLRIMKSQGQQQQVQPEKVEDLDLFIDRCMKEEDETLHSLAQICHVHLQQGRIVSLVHQQVLPQVIRRIQQRAEKGER